MSFHVSCKEGQFSINWSNQVEAPTFNFDTVTGKNGVQQTRFSFALNQTAHANSETHQSYQGYQDRLNSALSDTSEGCLGDEYDDYIPEGPSKTKEQLDREMDEYMFLGRMKDLVEESANQELIQMFQRLTAKDF
jgi:hypothetical protein